MRSRREQYADIDRDDHGVGGIDAVAELQPRIVKNERCEIALHGALRVRGLDEDVVEAGLERVDGDDALASRGARGTPRWLPSPSIGKLCVSAPLAPLVT